MDKDIDYDEFIAYASIPISCLKTGFRKIQLFDNNSNCLGDFEFARLFMRVKIEPWDPSIDAEVESKSEKGLGENKAEDGEVDGSKPEVKEAVAESTVSTEPLDDKLEAIMNSQSDDVKVNDEMPIVSDELIVRVPEDESEETKV